MGWGTDYEGILTPNNISLTPVDKIIGVRWQDDIVWKDVDESISREAVGEWSSLTERTRMGL